MCAHMYTCKGRCPQNPEVGTESPATRITGDCEPSDMDARRQTQSSGRAVCVLHH